MKRSTKYLKISINIIAMLAMIIMAFFLLPKLVAYFLPFVIAAVIAMIANPLVKIMEKRLKLNRKAGTAVIIILVIALVIIVLYFLINWLINELLGFMETAPVLWENTSTTLKDAMNEFRGYMDRLPGPARSFADDFSSDLTGNITSWIQSFSKVSGRVVEVENKMNFAQVFVGTIMCIIASYFFVADKEYLLRLIDKYMPVKVRRRFDLVYGTMKNAVGVYFVAQFKIMAIVYAVLLIGMLILGVKYALFIALVIAMLDFLPFFGTGTAMIPWAIIKALQQDYKMAIGLLVLWAVSQAVRQIVQPKFVGDGMGLDPIPTLLVLYLGFKMGGAIGLIISIPIGMIVINLYKAGVFSNFSYSLRMLFKDIDDLRRFDDEELKAEGIEPIVPETPENIQKRK
ncbi:MAG: sporulation integral membrane protein YtvI [Lachnospiraceae bacterium]|nr:sporulation integral membrane protein YtvI [Lachnospiraceae bacterium]